MLTSGTKSVYRNPIYRERRVKLEFLPSPDINIGVELTEVTTFDVQTNSGTATSFGVKKAVIQPWYFGPYTIVISGKSYMGAYASVQMLGDSRLNYNKDVDVTQLLQFTQTTKQLFLSGQPNQMKYLLSCYDSQTPSNTLGISTQYQGILDEVKYTEDESNPYIMNYSIKFIGEIYSDIKTDEGKEGNTLDEEIGDAKVITSTPHSGLKGDLTKGVLPSPTPSGSVSV